MPKVLTLVTRPLTRFEISQVLQGMTDSTPTIPAGVRAAAFWCTLENLSNWCNPVDVEAARSSVSGPMLTA